MDAKSLPPFDEPMEVSEHGGEIIILGPDGIHGSFLPDAAEESGRRLIDQVALLRRNGPTPMIDDERDEEEG